jgi:hypothetical protein
MDYTTLPFAELSRAFHDIGSEAEVTFGALDARQLNWRSDERRWSVAQCFQHLLTSNDLMLRAAQAALDNPPWTIWQRLPFIPGLLGRALIRSQAPDNTRKYVAPPSARPASSEISPDVIGRFVQQHHDTAVWVDALTETDARSAIMISPFLKVISYSVLDGCRLLVAHDRRHFEQARRVIRLAEFPAPS